MRALIARVPVELRVANARGMSISAHAPYPHAGLLLLDSLISREGQKLLTERFAYNSATKGYGFEAGYPGKGLSTSEYIEKTDQWMKSLGEIGYRSISVTFVDG
jgi:hypothetical protein